MNFHVSIVIVNMLYLAVEQTKVFSAMKRTIFTYFLSLAVFVAIPCGTVFAEKADFSTRYKFKKDRGYKWADASEEDQEEFLKELSQSHQDAIRKEREYLDQKNEAKRKRENKQIKINDQVRKDRELINKRKENRVKRKNDIAANQRKKRNKQRERFRKLMDKIKDKRSRR